MLASLSRKAFVRTLVPIIVLSFCKPDDKPFFPSAPVCRASLSVDFMVVEPLIQLSALTTTKGRLVPVKWRDWQSGWSMSVDISTLVGSSDTGMPTVIVSFRRFFEWVARH